jgi:hypothetical protein
MLGYILLYFNATRSGLEDLLDSLPFVAFLLVGAVICLRRPENGVGWIFLTCGVANGVWLFAYEHAIYANLTNPGSLPSAPWLTWLGMGWIEGARWLLMFTFVLLLYPTGRIPSPHWRWLAWLCGILVPGLLALQAVAPLPLNEEYPSIKNPFGLEEITPLVGVLSSLTPIIFVVLTIACAASVIARFRTARGDERQQLKWFYYSAVLLVVLMAVTVVSDLAGRRIPDLPSILLFLVPVTGLPVAAGIAILKYRLYDIDLLINRTLVYGALSIVLALLYVGIVVLLQRLLNPVLGEENDLAIVLSTLAIAALFLPLKQRIQTFIDRRFYRGKYNAVRTLSAFSETVRDEVDLQSLADHLVQVVEQTMQPSHVSLWLRWPEMDEQGSQVRAR